MLGLTMHSVQNMRSSQRAANEDRCGDQVHCAPVSTSRTRIMQYNHGTSTEAVEEARDIPQPPATARIPFIGDF